MTLESPTKEELAHLRNIIQTSNGRIKHLTIHHTSDSLITITAQANTKLSAKAWRSALGKRVQGICRLQPQPAQPQDEVFGSRGKQGQTTQPQARLPIPSILEGQKHAQADGQLILQQCYNLAHQAFLHALAKK